MLLQKLKNKIKIILWGIRPQYKRNEIVKVTKSDSYYLYTEWFDFYKEKELKKKFVKEVHPPCEIGIIKAVHPHIHINIYFLEFIYAVEINNQIYLLSEDNIIDT